MRRETGWKPIPISLKILFVVFILWMIGSIMHISTLYKEGLPFYGLYLYGIAASIIVILLDIVGPTAFLFGLWHRKSWAPSLAYTYMAVFSLNHVVAFFIFREKLGLMQILIPTVANIIFFVVIYKSRSYFK